jgi:hypothetical protein
MGELRRAWGPRREAHCRRDPKEAQGANGFVVLYAASGRGFSQMAQIP